MVYLNLFCSSCINRCFGVCWLNHLYLHVLLVCSTTKESVCYDMMTWWGWSVLLKHSAFGKLHSTAAEVNYWYANLIVSAFGCRIFWDMGHFLIKSFLLSRKSSVAEHFSTEHANMVLTKNGELIAFVKVLIDWPCSLFAESCKPSNGFHTDPSWNAGPWQHAVLC